MSYTILIQDSYIDFSAEAGTPLSAQGTHCASVLDAQAYLNVVMPMKEYHITEAGPTPRWTFNARARDNRMATAIITYVGGAAQYELNNMAACSQREIEAFLKLLETWGVVLETHEFSRADVEWLIP